MARTSRPAGVFRPKPVPPKPPARTPPLHSPERRRLVGRAIRRLGFGPPEQRAGRSARGNLAWPPRASRHVSGRPEAPTPPRTITVANGFPVEGARRRIAEVERGWIKFLMRCAPLAERHFSGEDASKPALGYGWLHLRSPARYPSGSPGRWHCQRPRFPPSFQNMSLASRRSSAIRQS